MVDASRLFDRSQLTDVTVLLVDDDEQWARVTSRLLESANDAFDVELAHSLSAGRDRFDAIDPDCVISDYQLGDGTGLDFLETVRSADPDRPFVLVTGRGDEAVASEAIGRGVTDYIPKDHDDTDATLLVNRVTNAVVSARARNQLDRERRGKAATLNLLTSTTSLTDLLEQFCRVLVADHGYAGAWIGGMEDASSGGIVPNAVDGCEAYLDAVADDGAVSTDCADPAAAAVARDRPVAASASEASREQSPGDIHHTEPTEAWTQLADQHGVVSAVGIPLMHDGVREGVLAVYQSSDDPPLDETRWQLLEEYAEIVCYACRRAEMKRSLLADEPVSVDIEISDPAAPLAALTDRLNGGSLEVVSTIEREDSTTLYLTRIAGMEPDVVRSAADACESVEIGSCTETDDGLRCELHTSGRTPADVLAARGARIEQTMSTDGTVTLSVSVGDHSVVSSLTEALRAEYDEVSIATLWNGPTDHSTAVEDPLEPLTDRQLDVLSHAYFDGYFEQPRGVSATELSEKFDIARVTMTQHLRAAQRKVFEGLLEPTERRRALLANTQ